MNKSLSITLVVVGLILLTYAFSAADSISSGFSRLFTGSPSDKAIWLLICGSTCLVIGGTRLLRHK